MAASIESGHRRSPWTYARRVAGAWLGFEGIGAMLASGFLPWPGGGPVGIPVPILGLVGGPIWWLGAIGLVAGVGVWRGAAWSRGVALAVQTTSLLYAIWRSIAFAPDSSASTDLVARLVDGAWLDLAALVLLAVVLGPRWVRRDAAPARATRVRPNAVRPTRFAHRR